MPVSLKGMNSFGVEARAEKLLRVDSVENLLQWAADHPGEEPLILGGGSNILFVDDPCSWVLKNELKGRRIIEEKDNRVILELASGEDWHETVGWTVEQGFGGLENLALIPGSVGAAPVQNIGAYGVELKDRLVSLEYLDMQTGLLHEMEAGDCGFGYRNSRFKRELKNRAFITRIRLRLTRQKHEINTSYAALKKYLDDRNIRQPGPKAVFDAVTDIRQSKLPDPRLLGNAGSFFKNPVISLTVFSQLQKDYPDIPYFPSSDNRVKLAAGWLLDQAGWKGKRTGDVGTYHKQALVIVNHGKASGLDIYNFSLRIKAAVYHKFGIVLEEEVNIIK
jgi:UDP-N-acetylmuramate dehydrogenase